MYSWRRDFNIVTFLLLSHFLSTAAAPANASDFPGHHSDSRMAYFRWRAWLLSHPAVVQKVPPVPRTAEANGKGGLDVHVRMTPAHIFKVDEVQQTVHLAAVFEFWWVDPALAVDSDLVQVFTDGNSSLLPYSITVPSKVLWVPNLVVVEGVSSLEIMQDVNEVQVQPDGNVSIILPYVLTFTCRFDMTGYPFDEHECSITVLDSSYSVNVHPPGRPWDSNLTQSFGVVGEWKLVNVTEKTLVYSLSGQIYPQFILHLRRKPTFYVVILICPLVLTSYLNTLVFLLPPDLGDKASYLVTLAISMSVFTSFFNADMPRGLDSMPRIFLLHLFVLAESLVTLVMSLIVLRRYKSEQRQKNAERSAASGAWSMKKDGVSATPCACDEINVKRMKIGHVSAKRLDTIFFVVAFTGNTIGITVIMDALV